MVTMELGTRQIKFFDTKLQMFESLNFVQKITNSQITKPNHNTASVWIITEGKKLGGRFPVLATRSIGIIL
jgi:hypothetical protein